MRDVHHPPPQVAPLQKLHGKPGPIIIGAQRLVIPLVVTLIAATGGGIWADVRLTRDSSLASNASTAQLVAPTSAEVARAEAEREVAGSQVRDLTLTAAPARIDLGDRVVSAWAFDAKVPGPTVRVNAGDVVRAKVVNDLPADLTAHWHGPAVRNDMDGVPDLTQKAIAPGDSFIYEFTAPDPGTYFYHPTHRHPAQPRSLRCARL